MTRKQHRQQAWEKALTLMLNRATDGGLFGQEVPEGEVLGLRVNIEIGGISIQGYVFHNPRDEKVDVLACWRGGGHAQGTYDRREGKWIESAYAGGPLRCGPAMFAQLAASDPPKAVLH